MSAALAIIKEVESTLRDASQGRCTDILRKVTDLFLASPEANSGSHLALFDGVMGQLIAYVEQKAVAELSQRIAPLANAPRATLGKLARHDNIEISGPILATSPALTDSDLIEIASTKSQAHLAEIALRPRLNAKVTDALVDHGDNKVANRLAANTGAQFSNTGMAKMVMRAEGDDQLTMSIAGRNDIPLRFYEQLLAQATVVVRKKLVAQAKPEQLAAIEQVMKKIASEVTPRRASVPLKARADQNIAQIGQDTDLLKVNIVKFANERRLPEMLAGLSMLGRIPFEVAEHLFHVRTGFGIVVLCKALGFDWFTTDALILASPRLQDFDQPQLDELHEQYDALSMGSAQRMVRFWEGRQAVITAIARPAAAAKPLA